MSVLVIGGPTAVGKSALSLKIAQALSAPIISADAMTIYRDLDIGTAKPSLSERATVQHFCLNVRNYNEEYTVGDFVEDVDKVLAEHEHVIIAGGTPYYLNALFKPMAPLPQSQPEIRHRLEQLEAPFEHLKRVDPVIAQKLHPNDMVRVIRALEVFEITGRPMSEVQQDSPKRPPLNAKIIWMDRDGLRERIGQRIQIMLEEGYLEECRQILSQQWDLSAKPLQSFSYKFFLQYLQGEISYEEAIERTEIGTWHLARKQRTWSRNIGWSSLDPHEAEKEARHWVSSLL